MIGELINIYERLQRDGKAPKYGYSVENVSYGLDIDEAGHVINLIPFGKLVSNNFRMRMEVPMHASNTSGIKASFLCAKAPYLLGEDAKGKSERALKEFEAAKEYHDNIIIHPIDQASKAVLAFFALPPQAGIVKELVGKEAWNKVVNSRLVICLGDRPLTRNSVLQHFWETWYEQRKNDEEGDESSIKPMQSMVTGKTVIPALTHPLIKGVPGTKPSGAALVSFNKKAFCSYNKKQDTNAPMSGYEAFAYSTALNIMLHDRQYCKTVNKNSLTILCWAESGEVQYSTQLFTSLYADSSVDQKTLLRTISELAEGRPVVHDGINLNPGEHFYILGLVPNAARLSVSFFLKDTFGRFMQNVHKHYADLDIVRPQYDDRTTLPVWSLLAQTQPRTTNRQASAEVSSSLIDELFRSILLGTSYPTSLLNMIQIRIAAEHKVNRDKAAIIKAYYLRHANSACPKEVLQVSLNEKSNDVPYVLGRLFALYEEIQYKANINQANLKHKINTTIVDQYFTNASIMPAVVFPRLGDLANKHLHKLPVALRNYYITQIKNLMVRIGKSFPTRLSLPEQGAFQLGYYFQTQERYSGDKKIQDKKIDQEEGPAYE